jgi:hypothetical protein
MDVAVDPRGRCRHGRSLNDYLFVGGALRRAANVPPMAGKRKGRQRSMAGLPALLSCMIRL